LKEEPIVAKNLITYQDAIIRDVAAEAVFLVRKVRG
jgi:hypothetical protein